MSFEWKQYVQLAGELIDSSKTSPIKEAYFRCIVSRAYYGVFCAARDFLGVVIPEMTSVHSFVVNEYKRSNDKNKRMIGATLDRLKRDRIKADYKSNVLIDYNYAARVYYKSKQLLKQLEVLSC